MAVCCWVAVWPHPPPILPTPVLGFVPPNIPSSVTFPLAGLVCSFVLARPLPGRRCVEVCATPVAPQVGGAEGGFKEAVIKDGKLLLLPPRAISTSPHRSLSGTHGALTLNSCECQVCHLEWETGRSSGQIRPSWFFIQRPTPAASTVSAWVSLGVDLNISSLQGSGAETWYKCKAKCIWYWSAASRAIHTGCPSLAAKTRVALCPSLTVWISLLACNTLLFSVWTSRSSFCCVVFFFPACLWTVSFLRCCCCRDSNDTCWWLSPLPLLPLVRRVLLMACGAFRAHPSQWPSHFSLVDTQAAGCTHCFTKSLFVIQAAPASFLINSTGCVWADRFLVF